MTIRSVIFLAGVILAGTVGAASATEPLVLTNTEMDQVSAGAYLPFGRISDYNSIGAYAFSDSQAISIPGRTIVIDTKVTTNVGLKTNGFTFKVKVTNY